MPKFVQVIGLDDSDGKQQNNKLTKYGQITMATYTSEKSIFYCFFTNTVTGNLEKIKSSLGMVDCSLRNSRIIVIGTLLKRRSKMCLPKFGSSSKIFKSNLS